MNALESPLAEFTHIQRRRLMVLAKRCIFLEKRAADAERHGKDFSYDREEASALRWIIEHTLTEPRALALMERAHLDRHHR